MDVALVSALSALAGSAVGGLSSSGTTWLTQRAQSRAARATHEMSRREDLYRDFILAASNAYGAALGSTDPKIADLIGLYAMVSRMRVVSTPAIVACADKIMLIIIDTYFAPKKSVLELRDLIKVGAVMDPLREFSETAREELRQTAWK